MGIFKKHTLLGKLTKPKEGGTALGNFYRAVVPTVLNVVAPGTGTALNAVYPKAPGEKDTTVLDKVTDVASSLVAKTLTQPIAGDPKNTMGLPHSDFSSLLKEAKSVAEKIPVPASEYSSFYPVVSEPAYLSATEQTAKQTAKEILTGAIGGAIGGATGVFLGTDTGKKVKRVGIMAVLEDNVTAILISAGVLLMAVIALLTFRKN